VTLSGHNFAAGVTLGGLIIQVRKFWWEKNWQDFFCQILKFGGSKMIYKKLFNQNRETAYDFIQAFAKNISR